MSKKYFENKYDRIFGKDTLKKLIETKKNIYDDQYLRINLSKISISEVESFLKKNRVRYEKTMIKNCLKINKSFFNLSASILSLTGKIYIQDIASQIPLHTINFLELKKKKNINILDMAAAPGSKTTQLIDMLNFNNINYMITAIEMEPKRLTKLINNIQKQGLTNIKIINSKAQDFKSKDKYDLIILDAPCSGNLISERNWLDKRDEKGIINNSKIQKQIFENATKLLKNNGEIIYSTCSIEPEENELNLIEFNKNKYIKNIQINLKLPFNVNPINKIENKKINVKALRFMPNITKTQGFFIAKYKRL